MNHYACVSCGRRADDRVCVRCAPEQRVESEPSRVRPYLRLDDAATAVQDTIEQVPRVAATGRHRIRDPWLTDESWSPTTNTGTMDKPDDATTPSSAPAPSLMPSLIESTLHKHRAAVGITVAATILAGVFVSMANDQPESSSPAKVDDRLSVTSDDAGPIHIAPQSSVAQRSPLPSSAVGVPASGVAGSTFTLSDGGHRGALFELPALNPGEVGRLGVGAVVERPVGRIADGPFWRARSSHTYASPAVVDNQTVLGLAEQ